MRTPQQFIEEFRHARKEGLPPPDPETIAERDLAIKAFPEEVHRWRPSREQMAREGLRPVDFGANPELPQPELIEGLLRLLKEEKPVARAFEKILRRTGQ